MTSPRYPQPPDPDDDLDLAGIEYFDRVGADLVSAAGQRGEARRPLRPVWARPAMLTGVAAAVLVLGFVGLQLVATDDAVEAIDVQRLEDRTVITIDELIDDPRAVEAELSAAGVATAVVGRLAPPDRVGELVAVDTVGGEGGPEVTAEFVDGDRIVDVVVVPAGFSGTLELVVGVAATNDLGLVYGGPPADCERLVLRPVSEVIDELRELDVALEWTRATVGGIESVGEEQVPPTDVVIDLFAVSDGRMMVTTTDDPEMNLMAVPPCEG
ncbi:MAG: hypothetical protein AAFZ07_17460 [Actinomycetota bacterium]